MLDKNVPLEDAIEIVDGIVDTVINNFEFKLSIQKGKSLISEANDLPISLGTSFDQIQHDIEQAEKLKSKLKKRATTFEELEETF